MKAPPKKPKGKQKELPMPPKMNFGAVKGKMPPMPPMGKGKKK